MTRLSVLRKKIQNSFDFLNGYLDGEYPIDGLPENYPASVYRLSGETGVMVDAPDCPEINENFNLISVRTANIISGDGDSVRKLLLCTKRTDSGFFDNFSLFCADFVDTDDLGYKRNNLISDPFTWYSEWKTMIGNNANKKMPASVLAELICLDYLSSEGTIPVWEGPNSGIVDIRTDLFDVEVKSSLFRDRNEIQISSENQLNNEDKPLHLYYCCFQESESGFSIEEIYQKLVRKGFDSDELEDKISKCGYGKGKLERYSKFILVKLWDFEIDENFPKIIPSSFADGVLPQNVTKITYTVELSGIPHKPIGYQPFEPESTEGEYDPVEKWIISKIRLGKSIDYLLSLPSEQSFFNFAYEIQDWPAGTLTKWHELVEKCSSFLKIGNKSCWSTVSERIYANGYDKQIFDSNCKSIGSYLNERCKTDGCVRTMVLSQTGNDTVDLISGLIAKQADEGWNIFVLITDNYDIEFQQVSERVIKNLGGSGDSFSWKFIDVSSIDYASSDLRLIPVNSFNSFRFLVLCKRNSSQFLKVNRWLEECGESNSKIKLAVIDNRSDLPLEVCFATDNEHFFSDDFVNRLSGYSSDSGDGNSIFANLAYFTFVQSPIHLLINNNYSVNNPIDCFICAEPPRQYFSYRSLFTEKPDYSLVTIADADSSVLRYRCNHNYDIPDSLKESLAWFICASAVMSSRNESLIPCMLVLCDKSHIADRSLDIGIESFYRNEKDVLIEMCKEVYVRITSRKLNTDFSKLYGTEFEKQSYPPFKEIEASIYSMIYDESLLSIHLDDRDSVNMEYDILDGPTVVVNYGSSISLTEKSCVLSSYYSRIPNTSDVAMRMGPWSGNHVGYHDLWHIWMSERSYGYFAYVSGIENRILRKAHSNLYLATRMVKDKDVRVLLNGNYLGNNIKGPFNRLYSNEYRKCDVCGSQIEPGTVYLCFYAPHQIRCMGCYEKSSSEFMEKNYGYLVDALKDIIELFSVRDTVSLSELDLMFGTRERVQKVINSMRIEGFVFEIDRSSNYSIAGIPGMMDFIHSLRECSLYSDIKKLHEEYSRDWRLIYRYLMRTNGREPAVYSKDSESHFYSAVQELSFVKEVEIAECRMSDYSDISDNDETYYRACDLVRENIFYSVIRRVLENSSEIEFSDDYSIIHNGSVKTCDFCYSDDKISEDSESDLIIVMSDDEILVLDVESDPLPISEYFSLDDSYHGDLNYLFRLREVGF